MILKKRMNRIKATWRNGCFEKMDDDIQVRSPTSNDDLCPFFFLYPSSMVSQDHVWPYEFAQKHRRRIFTEEKAKVVAAIWKIELIKILAVLFTMSNRLI